MDTQESGAWGSGGSRGLHTEAKTTSRKARRHFCPARFGGATRSPVTALSWARATRTPLFSFSSQGPPPRPRETHPAEPSALALRQGSWGHRAQGPWLRLLGRPMASQVFSCLLDAKASGLWCGRHGCSRTCPRTCRGSRRRAHLEVALRVSGQLGLGQEAPLLLLLGQHEPCHALCLAGQRRLHQVFALLDKL